MTPRHRSRSQCYADKNMGKDGFHQRGPDTHELKICSLPSRSILHGQENCSNSPPDGSTEPLEKFSRDENLDDSDQFILGRDFVGIFDVTIDLFNGLRRTRDGKDAKRTVNRRIPDENTKTIL